MTCDDVELLLVTQDPLTPEAREHLTTCTKCRAFEVSSAQLVADAALPALSPEERAALQGLAPRLHHSWKVQARRRSFAQRVVGLALAACFGAAVACAALLPQLQQRSQHLVASNETEWSLPAVEPETVTDSPDELDTYEVGWPSLEEGVAP